MVKHLVVGYACTIVLSFATDTVWVRIGNKTESSYCGDSLGNHL